MCWGRKSGSSGLQSSSLVSILAPPTSASLCLYDRRPSWWVFISLRRLDFGSSEMRFWAGRTHGSLHSTIRSEISAGFRAVILKIYSGSGAEWGSDRITKEDSVVVLISSVILGLSCAPRLEGYHRHGRRIRCPDLGSRSERRNRCWNPFCL